VPCMVKQALKAASYVTDDIKVREKVLREVMKRLLEISWEGTPPQLAHRLGVVSIIKSITGNEDPYKEAKKRCNDVALSLYPAMKEMIRFSDEPLRTATLLSIAANVMDLAAYDSFDLEETVSKVLKQGFTINDYELFKKKVVEADTLLFFADNAGEIVFDKLLIETMHSIRERYFSKVTYVVKGGPIVNDATIEDVKYVGLDKLPNIGFRFVSNGEPDTGPERRSEEVKSWIEEHDLVIAKGQGNYEDLSDFKGIFFLLMVKCPVIARDLGVDVGSIILKYTY